MAKAKVFPQIPVPQLEDSSINIQARLKQASYEDLQYLVSYVTFLCLDSKKLNQRRSKQWKSYRAAAESVLFDENQLELSQEKLDSFCSLFLMTPFEVRIDCFLDFNTDRDWNRADDGLQVLYYREIWESKMDLMIPWVEKNVYPQLEILVANLKEEESKELDDKLTAAVSLLRKNGYSVTKKTTPKV